MLMKGNWLRRLAKAARTCIWWNRLTGWNLNVMTRTQAQARRDPDEALQRMFMEQLSLDEDVAAILVREGFAGLDQVAYVPAHEMLEIPEFDIEIVEELRGRA